MTITPQQRVAMNELVSQGAGINCYPVAELLVDTLEQLVADGISAVDVIRWLSLLPRVRNRATALEQAPPIEERQHSVSSPVDELPDQMRRALSPASGQSKDRPSRWLLDPTARTSGKPGPRAEREARRRPETGTCAVCGSTFPMNPTGRPATTCEEHRFARPSRPRKASA